MFATILSFITPLLTSGKSFFSKNKYSVIITAITAILVLVLYLEINKKESQVQDLKISNANLIAQQDSIRITTTKNNQIEFDKYAFLAKKNKDLQKINDSLYNKIKNTKGTPIAVISSSNIISDSNKNLIVKDIKKDSTGSIDVELSFDTVYSKGNYHHLELSLSGIPDRLDFKGTLIKDEIGFTATTGIKKDEKGNYEIFVQPDYPGTKITSLTGAYIDPNIFQKPDKKRILTLGASFGYIPILYNWSTKQTSILGQNIGLSVGVNINLTELFRKK